MSSHHAHRVESEVALAGVIGRTSEPINLKVIDHLDDGAVRWLRHSPLIFGGFGSGGDIGLTPGGGAAAMRRGLNKDYRANLY